MNCETSSLSMKPFTNGHSSTLSSFNSKRAENITRQNSEELKGENSMSSMTTDGNTRDKLPACVCSVLIYVLFHNIGLLFN